ncbi:MAG: hypothetical protein ABIH67_05190 [Candidatus Uhrbacteria bacterium]
MLWDKLEVTKHQGSLPSKESFVREVNKVTANAFGFPVPLQETYEHLAESNLGHFVYVVEDGRKRLIAYALNDVFTVQFFAQYKVNYFSSAFILPEMQRNFALYKMLGTLRLMRNEDMIVVRTQSPIVMTFFAWLCEFNRMRLLTHLSTSQLPQVDAAIEHKFGTTNMVHPGAYGRCLTGEPIKPKTLIAQQLSKQIDATAGDAIILVGIR